MMDRKKFDRDFDNFDRNFKLMSRFVWGFIIFVAVVIIGGWGLIGYGAYTIASNPEKAANSVGSFIGSIVNGAKKGFDEAR